MKNKKTIMAISALFIIIFHLWINITNSIIEIFLRQLCIIGVDLFLFVSAYTISKRKSIKYKEFLINRFNNIYLKFIILSTVCALYSSWSLPKLFITITGIDLFVSGGGSFLWFIPGIMIIYLLLPLYKRINERHPAITPIILTCIYIFFSVTLSLFSNYRQVFILTNRIPILLLGFYIGKYNIIERLKENNIKYWVTTITLLIIGIMISYISFISRIRIDWFYDIFYLLNIPIELGFILLLNKIKENKIINIISSCTLEIYGIQMIFGFKIANDLYHALRNPIICNIITITLLLILSIILKIVFDNIANFFKKNLFDKQKKDKKIDI